METNLVCYSFGDTYGDFNGATTGDFDPLDESNILWPANTTPIAPPNFKPGTIPVFNKVKGKWEVVPDFRGQTGYREDGSRVIIDRPGNPSTFTPPLSRTNPHPTVPTPEEDGSILLRTSKVAFWRRATDQEAAQFLADLTDASPRLKSIFDAVMYLTPGSPEYPDLRAAIEARVGPERADELLAPSND